jgi:hypothetical protein
MSKAFGHYQQSIGVDFGVNGVSTTDRLCVGFDVVAPGVGR